jgi:hypothetical protein
MSDLPPCNKNVRKYGQFVTMLDATPAQAEEFCKQRSNKTGDQWDWFYAAGRVQVMRLSKDIQIVADKPAPDNLLPFPIV